MKKSRNFLNKLSDRIQERNAKRIQDPVNDNNELQETKPQKMKVVLKVLKGIGKGVLDTVFPNVTKSFRMSESDLPNDPQKKYDIDFPRLITAITVWIILLLVFFGKIKFEDVVDLIQSLLQ